MYRAMVGLGVIEIAAVSGLLCWLFSSHLTHPGEVFGWWPGIVQRLTSWEPANRLLYGCGKCMAGFYALWAGLLMGHTAGAFLASAGAMLVVLMLDRYL